MSYNNDSDSDEHEIAESESGKTRENANAEKEDVVGDDYIFDKAVMESAITLGVSVKPKNLSYAGCVGTDVGLQSKLTLVWNTLLIESEPHVWDMCEVSTCDATMWKEGNENLDILVRRTLVNGPKIRKWDE